MSTNFRVMEKMSGGLEEDKVRHLAPPNPLPPPVRLGRSLC